MISNTCPFYEITVTACDKAIRCDQCNKCTHIICNNLNDLDHEDLMIRDESWHCKACIQENLPFCITKGNSNNSLGHLRNIDPKFKNL